jgi:5-dehydro-2-deoxygluconokinase
MPRDYDRPSYSQPLDHRGSFQPGLFGWKPPLCETQTAESVGAKWQVDHGFRSALAAGALRESGILVDEKFSAAILCDPTHGLITACPAERSGRDEFDLNDGEHFALHIEAFVLIFCKELVRDQPESDRALNREQAERPKRASGSRFRQPPHVRSSWCRPKRPARQAQGKKAYALELRPGMMLERELQAARYSWNRSAPGKPARCRASTPS